MSTAVILCLALILDAIAGEPDWLWRRLPHPAVLMGRAVGALDRRFNRGSARRLRGIVSVLALCVLAGLVGFALSEAFGVLAELLCAAILLAQRSLADHVQAVATGLRQDLDAGKSAVAMIVSRDTSAMQAPDVARAAIESGSENLSDGVIAPAFWFLIAGLPGLFVYKIVNTADSMIGYRTDRHRDFGWAAARLDDVLNMLPARLTGLLIWALTGFRAALADIIADARLHRSPNAGWPEAAMARHLGIALAGPRVYDGELRELAWVNERGAKEIGAAHISRSVAALWQVWGLFLALILLVAIAALVV